MTAFTGLLVFATVLAVLAPPVLRRSVWLERTPRLGIAVWQTLSFAVVSAAVLAGVGLALPAIPWTTDLAELLRVCVMALREQYSTPAGAVASATGAAFASAVLGRSSYTLIAGLHHSRRESRRQLEALSLVADRHQSNGALILTHSSAAAYCLPGRHRQIVLTSAAVEALDCSQLEAVLAHERSHLCERHHLVISAADALVRAFPWVRLFRVARGELGRLVEMQADDDAVASSDRLTVASALVRLAEKGATPAVALAAGGPAALERIQRLLRPAGRLSARGRVVAAAAVGALLVVPLLLASGPAASAVSMPPCPVGDSTSV